MKPNCYTHSRPRARARGFTLIELLVAMAIGLALTLALSTVMIRHDSGKRTLISTNDLSLTSSYVSFSLDRELRSAGSGFTQASRNTFGCLLRVARGGAQILPRAAAFPAPFDGVPQQVRLAPLLVHAGAGAGGSDVLAVATGSAGLGEAPIQVQSNSATAADLRVSSTVGLRGNDLVLVAEDGVGCVLQQVAAPFAGGADQLLSFGGTYAKAVIDSLQLADFGISSTAFVSLLGNTTGNRPMLRLFGVGANATLFSHDMLQLDGNDTAQPVVDGVADLRALYGVDTTIPADGDHRHLGGADGSGLHRRRVDRRQPGRARSAADDPGGARGHGAALRPHRARRGGASHPDAVRRPAGRAAAQPCHRSRPAPPALPNRGVHGAAAQRDDRRAL